MKISDLRELLKNKLVVEEINKHLWIESQKAGYSIGIERATDEWLRLYAMGWMKYHMPEKYEKLMTKKNRKSVRKVVKEKVVKKVIKKTVRKIVTKKSAKKKTTKK
ncbi:MAG: hypothetical protein K8S27_11145 [Candidatus Omnitrophica bacterium]|nr:hypothetical protein [Candidatus Omnitrophota bacterium]